MQIREFIKKGILLISILAYSPCLLAQALPSMEMPSLDTPLNDFNPEYPVGRYIQQVSSNMVEDAVQLTNGVLTVGGESINIAEPVRVSISTNNGEVVTNTYYAVYEDELQKQLEDYAPKKKMVSIGEGGVTNYTSVAYLSDIPEDTKKADKMMLAKEYLCESLGVVLSLVYTPEAPLSAWAWTSTESVYGYTELTLFYTNKVWTLVSNGSTTESIRGNEGQSGISFPSAGLIFSPINSTNSYVVYTTQMEKYTKAVLTDYVSKSNLNSIAEEITEDKLQNLDGIVNTLKGIKGAINEIVGLPSLRFTIRKDEIEASGSVHINSFETQTIGDSITIDWGDGTVYPMILEPTNHVYDTSSITSDVVTITIKGFIKSISGEDSVPFLYSKTLQGGGYYNKSSIPLKEVVIDEAVGLQELGPYTFYDSNLTDKDLSFLPSSVETLGEGCFKKCMISSLIGMPLKITAIPDNCFSSISTISSLVGMSPNVSTLGDYAFFECSNLASLNGISDRITTIPSFCFSGTALTSLNDLPYEVTSIGASAFQGIPITSLSGLDADIVDIGDYAFSECEQLTDATDLGSTRIAKLNKSFADCSNVEMLTLPTTITYIETDALARVGNSRDRTEITFNAKSIEVITNITSESNVPTFAWNLPNNGYTIGKTRIKGTDGTLRSVGDGTWELESTRSSFTLRGLAQDGPATVELGIIETPMVARDSIRAGPSFMVDWGDGTINSSNAHTYAGSSTPEIETQYTISILGKIDSIAGRDNKPFITVDNQQATLYLTSVTFGNAVGLKEIGDDTFLNCPNLSEVKGIYNTVTALGNRSFKGCYAFTNTDFLSRSSIAALPSECFASCTNLVSIEGLPDNSLSSIGDGCFSNCLNLVTLGSPKSVTYLGRNAFNYCLKITNVSSLVASVNTIAEGCFQNCGSLSEIGTLAHVTSIGARAFAGCPNISTLTIGSTATIGNNAFYEVATGSSVAYKRDEDNFNYKLLLDCSRSTYVEAAEMFGLQDGSIVNTRTGINPLVTKIVCSDGILYYNQKENTRQWEISMPALEIELENVPNNTTFIVQTAGTRAYQGAALIWNWGDGTVEQWITDSPKEHTYVNTGTSNYVIKVKGLLESISSLSEANGTYIRPKGRLENPYLVGYKISETSPIKTIGRASFSRCPKLKNLDTLNLPKPRSPTKLLKRDSSKSRLEQLSNEYSANKGRVGYEAYVFYKSGVQDMSGLPDNLGVLAQGLFQETQITDLSTLHKNVTDIEDSAFRGNTKLQRLYGFPTLVGDIKNYVFADCTNLHTLVDLRDVNLATIGEGAFIGSSSLKNVEGLTNRITNIGKVAFSGSGIKEFRDLPRAITNIGAGAFFNCFYATNGVIGRNISTIGDYFVYNGGKLATPYVDKLGLSPNLRITVEKSCDEWLGILTNTYNIGYTTQFICTDGIVCYGDIGWVPLWKSIDIQLAKVPPGTTLSLGNIISENNSPVKVNWGDGKEDTYYKGITHTYVGNGKYRITLSGEIRELHCENNRYPFLFQTYGAQGNPYITHISIGEALERVELGDRCFKGCSSLTSFQGTQYTKQAGLFWGNCYSLGIECFANCSSLSSLKGLPISISSIGEGCFSNCTSLESLEGYPGTITYIPSHCFENCTQITNLLGLINPIYDYQDSCFKNCKKLQSLIGMGTTAGTNSVRVGNNVFEGSGITNLIGFCGESLSKGLFKDCSLLVSLEGILNPVKTVPQECFYGCKSLLSLTTLPSTITTIESNAFSMCSKITDLKGLTNVTDIDAYAFLRCDALTSLVGLSSNIKYIGDYAFASNKNLQGFSPLNPLSPIYNNNVNFQLGNFVFLDCDKFGSQASFVSRFPSGIKSWGEGTFQGCNMRTYTSLPPKIRTIPNALFYNTSISNLVIDYNFISSIGTNSFARERHSLWPFSSSLNISREITFSNVDGITLINSYGFPFGASEKTLFRTKDSIIRWKNNKWMLQGIELQSNIVISSPQNSLSLRNIKTYGDEDYIIDWGDGTSSIVSSGSSSHSHSYSSIGSYTVKILGAIESILSSVDSKSFITCDGGRIGQINFTTDSQIISCGDYAFARLSALDEFPSFPSSLSTLGQYCFSSCSSLKEVSSFPSTVTNLNRGLFQGCTSLTNIVIPEVTRINEDCFSECSALRNCFSRSKTLTHIGSRAFRNCSSLKSLDLTQSYTLQNIGEEAFSGCTSLENLLFPSPNISFANNTFNNLGTNSAYKRFPLLENFQYKASISLDSLSNEVMGKPGFPFGAPQSTIFLTKDGIIYYQENKWTTYDSSLYCEINIDSTLINTPIQLTLINNKDKQNIIDWGDGSTISYTYQNNDEAHTFTHQYSSQGTYEISIKGVVNKLPTSTNNKSFLWNSKSLAFLKSISIKAEANLTVINPYALSGYVSLEEISLPQSLTRIENNAFEGCTGLLKMTLPQTVTYIGDYVFKNCTSLSLLFITPASSLSIGNYIFEGCQLLSAINISNSIWPSCSPNTFRRSDINAPLVVYAEKVPASSINSIWATADYSGLQELYGLSKADSIETYDGNVVFLTNDPILGTTNSGWWLLRNQIVITLKNTNLSNASLIIGPPIWYTPTFEPLDPLLESNYTDQKESYEYYESKIVSITDPLLPPIRELPNDQYNKIITRTEDSFNEVQQEINKESYSWTLPWESYRLNGHAGIWCPSDYTPRNNASVDTNVSIYRVIRKIPKIEYQEGRYRAFEAYMGSFRPEHQLVRTQPSVTRATAPKRYEKKLKSPSLPIQITVEYASGYSTTSTYNAPQYITDSPEINVSVYGGGGDIKLTISGPLYGLRGLCEIEQEKLFDQIANAAYPLITFRAKDPRNTNFYKIEIPEITSITIGNGCNVNKIGKYCFHGYNKVSTWVLSNTIRDIGEGAFMNSSFSDFQKLPKDITTIPDYCFALNKKITSLNSLSKNITSIGNYAFAGGPNSIDSNPVFAQANFIKSTIKDISALSQMSQLTKIGEGAFKDSSVQEVPQYPSQIRYISRSCYENTPVSKVSVHNNITSLEPYCFSGTHLKNLDWMTSYISAIGTTEEPAFINMPYLTNIDNLPSSISVMPKSSFSSCHSLQGNITFKKGFTAYHPTMLGLPRLAGVSRRLIYQEPFENTQVKNYINQEASYYIDRDMFFTDGTVVKTVNPDVVFPLDYTLPITLYKTKPIILFKSCWISALGMTVTLKGSITSWNPGDLIMINWGDGCVTYHSTDNSNTIPANTISHTYAEADSDINITICGWIKSITGNADRWLFEDNSTAPSIVPHGVEISADCGIKRIDPDLDGDPNVIQVKDFSNVAFNNALRSPYFHGLPTDCVYFIEGYPFGNKEKNVYGIDMGWNERYGVKYTKDANVEFDTYSHLYFVSKTKPGNKMKIWVTEVDNYKKVHDQWYPGQLTGKWPYEYVEAYWTYKLEKSGTKEVTGYSVKASNDDPMYVFYWDQMGGSSSRNARQATRSTDSNLGRPSMIRAIGGGQDMQFYNPIEVLAYEGEIQDFLFYNMRGLTNMPPILEDKEFIGKSAFDGTRIKDFGAIPATITNIGERAFASLEWQNYQIEILASITNLTIGKEAFGDIYPFGITKKVVDFPNIDVLDLISMPNFPFAKMQSSGGSEMEKPKSNYTNEFNVYRCKGGVELKPVNIGTESNVKWLWKW